MRANKKDTRQRVFLFLGSIVVCHFHSDNHTAIFYPGLYVDKALLNCKIHWG